LLIIIISTEINHTTTTAAACGGGGGCDGGVCPIQWPEIDTLLGDRVVDMVVVEEDFCLLGPLQMTIGYLPMAVRA